MSNIVPANLSKVNLFSKSGTKTDSQITLAAEIFGMPINHELLGLAYRSYLANGRLSSAKTLTRGEVRGGGKKPHKQKGTGRSRAGSSRIPHWRGGGVVFGATGNENYTINMSVTTKRQAIRQALSAQAVENKLVIIETFECPDGVVKPTVALLSKLGMSGTILLVVPIKDDMVDRATRNVAGLKTVQANYLNVFDILNADHIVVSKQSLEIIQAWLGSSKIVTKKAPDKSGDKV